MQAALEARQALRDLAPVQLEQLVHRELRALPLRRAPASLETRVLAEIEHRATVAWYHKSWSYWPAAVRAAFLVAGTTFASAAVFAFYRLSQGAAAATVANDVGSSFGWLTRLVGVVGWILNFAQQLLAAIPPLWFYGGLAFIGTLYAVFVGVGAVAYRYLYRSN